MHMCSAILGLLHVIRKWYWTKIEAPRRIANSLKNHLSNKKKKIEEASDDSDFEPDDDGEANKSLNQVEKAKLDSLNEKNKWHANRFPNAWLVWYLYGPPKGIGHPDIGIQEMKHLTKMKAAKKLNEEEEVVQLGQLHKVTRRMGKKNRGIRINNQEGDDDRTTISTHTLTGGLNEIKLVRSEAPSNAEQKMDKAISGLRNLILDLQQDIAEDGDDDGSKKK